MEKEIENIIKYLDDDMEDHEIKDFLDRVQSDHQFENLYFQIKEIYEYCELKNTKVDDEYLWKRLRNRVKEQSPSTYKSIGSNVFIRVAASILIITSLSYGVFKLLDKPEAINEPQYVQTIIPKTQKGQVILPDGTNVWLNSESILKYPATFEHKREVFLEGEAFFDVMKNIKPFTVRTSNIHIEVLGTSFNVTSYNNDNYVETTLVTGKIKIQSKDPGIFNRKDIILLPEQQATYDKTENRIALSNVKTELFTSWKKGEYIFEDEDLMHIAKKIERWFDVKIYFKSDNLKKLKLSGKIYEHEPIEQIVEMISLAADVNCKVEGNTITISNS